MASSLLLVFCSIFPFVYLLPTNGTTIVTPEYTLDLLTIGSISAEGTCTSNGVVCNTQADCIECNNTTFLPQYAIDGDKGTKWVSMPSFQNPSLTIDLGQDYNISSIMVLFKRSPLIWILEYSIDGQQFVPWVATVTQIEDCQNFTSYQLCGLSQTTTDNGSVQFELQLDDISRKVSILKFTFIEPVKSVNQDSSEEFFEIQEITVNSVCEDAITLFDNSNICLGINRLYNLVIPITGGGVGVDNRRFSWLQSEERVKPPLGSWFLDNILISGNNDSQLISENFETDQLNSTIWSVTDAQIDSVPCTTNSSDQVLLFSKSTTTDRHRGATLTGLPQQNLQNIEFDLGFLDPTLQCMTNLGEVELSYCTGNDNCNLIGVFVLNDCGNCVNKHLVRLRSFVSRLQMALIQLPLYSILIVANNTEFMIINNERAQYDQLTFDWLLGLVAIERVHGFPSQYPRNITLPTHIATIEVTTTNIELFEVYCEAVANITQHTDLDAQVNEISMLSSSLSQSVSDLTDEDVLFQREIEAVARNLSILLNELLNHYNNLLFAVENGNASLSLINTRQYEEHENQIMQLNITTFEAIATATEFNNIFDQHAIRLRNITNRLVLDRDYLEAVINSSETVINSIIDVSTINNEIEMILKEIEGQISLGNILLSLIETNLFNAQQYSNTTKNIVNVSNEVLNTTKLNITLLQSLVTLLEEQLKFYSTDLDLFLPSEYPSTCMPGLTEDFTCLKGEIHANNLEENSSRIISESFSTRRYASEFLASLASLPDIDFDGINRTAMDAIAIGNETLVTLEQTGLVELTSDVEETGLDINTLSNNVSSLLTNVKQTLLEAEIQFNRSVVLQNDLTDIENDFNEIQLDISVLENTQNYSIEAVNISNRMGMVHDTLDVINVTNGVVEENINDVNMSLMEVISTIEETELVLNYSEREVSHVQEFLSRTQEALDQTSFGLNNTIQQNIDIISDIDKLLLTVDATHELLKRINSPATFEASGSINPYISLQPPPRTQSFNDSIQFDSLEIYLNADSNYNSPSVLFYAGPLVEEGSHNNESILTSEDYLAIIDQRVPSDALTVEWRIGGNTDSISISYTIADQKQLYLRRVGSMFELSAGFEDNAVAPNSNYMLVEGSLLFKVTENTVFLIGGQPPGSLLAISNQEVYGSLSGTLDLLLYNGDLWSIWDYRRRSDTDFIARQFIRHEAAQDNVFIVVANPHETANVLSFDGTGYLKPKQFIDQRMFDLNTISGFIINYRLSSLEGLIMFLYDPDTSVSIEVAVYDGNVQAILNDGVNTPRYMKMISNDDFDGGILMIRFTQNLVLFDNQQTTDSFITFTDLTRVQAWFGGVILDQLPDTIRPAITTKRFRGCVNIIIDINRQQTNVFGQVDFFVENYLNSGIQKDVSATCFESSYAQEVSFNGTDYLSYNSIEVAGRADGRPVDIGVPQVSLSLSFFPLQDNVMLFTAINGDRMIIVELISQLIQVTIKNSDSDLVILRSTEPASLSEWHHLILEIRTTAHSEGLSQRLFVDNVLVNTSALAGFSFMLSSMSSANPTLYLGGAPINVSTATTPFVGCLKHFVYNLDAVKLFSSRLINYVEKNGITFFECLFLPDKLVSELPIVFSEPEMSGCGSSTEPEVFNDTIGGFHSQSQILSYNILPLQSSTWSFQLAMRRYSHDGHVITFPSNDVSLSLFVEGGNLKWYLIGQSDGSNASSTGMFVSTHVWHELQIDCNVSSANVYCVSTINGSSTDIISHDISMYVFYPESPVVIGKDGEKRGFVGCLRNLQVNGLPFGYELEGLSTCEHCYANPIDGWGFTGTGYLMAQVVSATNPIEFHIGFSFKPRRQQGLLLYLADDDPILGIGLFNGELRVTNFTSPGSFITLTSQLLCISNVELISFHTISIDVSQSSVTITLMNSINGEESTMTIQTVTMVINPLNIYIGGLEDTTVQDIGLFEFLLSDGGTALSSPVPKFIGCLQSVEVTTGTGTDNHISLVTDADHYEGVLDGLCPN